MTAPLYRDFLLSVQSTPYGLDQAEALGEANVPFRAAWEAGLIRVANKTIVMTDRGALSLSCFNHHRPSAWPVERTGEFYRRGYCHVLALALHQKTGLPLLALQDQAIRPFHGGLPIVHVGVAVDGGHMLDVEGARPLADTVSDCRARRPKFVPMTESELRQSAGPFASLAVFTDEDVTWAEEVAIRLGLATEYETFHDPMPH